MILNQFNAEQMKVFFFYSPVQELMTSLHVISNPSHHPTTQDWAKHKYQSLSKELRREIDFFGEQYADWFFIIDVILHIVESAYPEKLSVEETVERMMDMEPYRFAEIFLGLSAFDYSPDTLKKWIERPDCVTEEELGVQAHFLTKESVSYFLNDIGGMKKRLRWTILQYWEECFSKEWPSIEKYFAGIVRKEELALQAGNPLDYIKNLHPDLSVEEDRIIFHKEPEYSVPIEKIKNLVIVLSVFTAPHLSGNFVGNTLDIAKNLNFHSVKIQEDVPNGVTNLIYAVSDSTRMKIMKILWNSDTTTKELAEVLELSPSTISLHLKILKDAGMVETNKIKKFVYYKLKKEVFQNLQKDIVDYFEY